MIAKTIGKTLEIATVKSTGRYSSGPEIPITAIKFIKGAIGKGAVFKSIIASVLGYRKITFSKSAIVKKAKKHRIRKCTLGKGTVIKSYWHWHGK